MMREANCRDALCLELRSSTLGIGDLGSLCHRHDERFEIGLLPVHWVLIVGQHSTTTLPLDTDCDGTGRS